MRIENCVNTGIVIGTQGCVGGIVGLSSRVVDGCTIRRRLPEAVLVWAALSESSGNTAA